MSEIGTKTDVSTSNFDVDSEHVQFHSKSRLFHLVDSTRVGLTMLALAMGITVLGVSADSLAVYDATHVPAAFLLPLWPDNFDLRPTVALVVGSAIVIIANAISLAGSKIQILRSRPRLQMALSLITPAIAFIAALIAMSFFYAVNASTTADSFQSWTCRWKDVGMMVQPHFGTLCKQSKAGLALSVLLVPLEAIVLGLAGYQAVIERQLQPVVQGRQRQAGSPALS